ncbi:MAG TPA: serine/threonine-protein kinase, partial [Vicinamibacteria bacterium]
MYRARDPRLSRQVAVKILPYADVLDPSRVHRFEQEARAAGVLSHPNILVVFDAGSHKGVPYVVSELLEGETLRRHTAERRLPVRKALDYALQLAAGLGAAHEKGIVHRDLKPENIFVTVDGRVKILDFGLAKLRQRLEDAVGPEESTVSGVTVPGQPLGTAGYMSPEQVRGVPADNRSDIFSFGAVLYEMLSGRRAFSGRTAGEAMAGILADDPPPLGDLGVGPALDRVVRRCLEKRPADRFQSAHDLALALHAVAEQVARPPSPRRLIQVAIALLTVAVATGAIVFFWQIRPPRPLPVERSTGSVVPVTSFAGR